MSIVVQNIRLTVEQNDTDAIAQAQAIVGSGLQGAKIVKKAVDSRRKNVTFVYSVGFDTVEGEQALVEQLGDPNIVVRIVEEIELTTGNSPLSTRPIICGFGPAGMFAGLLLAQYGYRPIIFEGGSKVETRVEKIDTYWKTGVLDPRCNVQFGEGGAGTFSDGKLTTRIGDKRQGHVLTQLCKFGAPQEILSLAKPHIGTDKLRDIVKNIREEIIRLGGEIHFDNKVLDVLVKDNQIQGVVTEKDGVVGAQVVIMAIGHSARDTYEMLLEKGFMIEPKPFSVGVRMEHLQSDIDKMVYREDAGHKNLMPADYQLSYREGEDCCYSFCMCPGGTVVGAASEEGTICVNGMSEYKRDGRNGNSAIVVSVDPRKLSTTNPLIGMHFQRELEKKAFIAGGGKGAAPIQRLKDFMENRTTREVGAVKPTYTGNVKTADLNKILPLSITQMMKKGMGRFNSRLGGFYNWDALMTGVETRTSAPVRIVRNDGFESMVVKGVYPCGEGSGYAGGIVSAAVDGIKIATAIIEKFDNKA